MENKEEKKKFSFKDFKNKIKEPKFIRDYKVERQAQVDAVDLTKLSKPVNDVETSGPKKMKDFSNWASWKNALVGIVGIVFIVFVWWLYSYVVTNKGGTSYISSPQEVIHQFYELGIKGTYFWKHLGSSLQRIVVGYCVAFVCSIPIAFLMAWYRPFRAFLDPFIQFMRCIPPIAYVPIIVALCTGTGEETSKYVIIFIAVFLTMTVTIYQGVKNVDLTLVKAAYTFGAKDKNLFLDVIVPSAFPFILTAMRLGIGAAMTTLVAAELTGTSLGLGFFINSMANNLEMGCAMLGIIVLGIFGIIFDKLLLAFEKRMTRWK